MSEREKALAAFVASKPCPPNHTIIDMVEPEDIFRAGYDAREPEVSELKEEVARLEHNALDDERMLREGKIECDALRARLVTAGMLLASFRDTVRYVRTQREKEALAEAAANFIASLPAQPEPVLARAGPCLRCGVRNYRIVPGPDGKPVEVHGCDCAFTAGPS